MTSRTLLLIVGSTLIAMLPIQTVFSKRFTPDSVCAPENKDSNKTVNERICRLTERSSSVGIERRLNLQKKWDSPDWERIEEPSPEKLFSSGPIITLKPKREGVYRKSRTISPSINTIPKAGNKSHLERDLIQKALRERQIDGKIPPADNEPRVRPSIRSPITDLPAHNRNN